MCADQTDAHGVAAPDGGCRPAPIFEKQIGADHCINSAGKPPLPARTSPLHCRASPAGDSNTLLDTTAPSAAQIQACKLVQALCIKCLSNKQ